LESDSNKTGKREGALTKEELDKELITVRAKISCPKCKTEKIFKNQFKHSDLELMVVSLKVFDWLTCSKCGEILKLDLEFNI
jgi:DNA-directed RNA polymerase subunit RPC12/RpoP